MYFTPMLILSMRAKELLELEWKDGLITLRQFMLQLAVLAE